MSQFLSRLEGLRRTQTAGGFRAFATRNAGIPLMLSRSRPCLHACEDADAAGLAYDITLAWITLTVRSPLEAGARAVATAAPPHQRPLSR
jgi:hypothetical protein